jgi:hypothetical protein
MFLPRRFSLLLCVLLCSSFTTAQTQQDVSVSGSNTSVKRHSLDDFWITLRPVPEAFTTAQTEFIRTTAEIVLDNYLRTYQWDTNTVGSRSYSRTAGSPVQVTYVGLARVESKLYEPEEETARLLLGGGLVYFTDDTPWNSIPDQAGMIQLVTDALGDVFLAELQQSFPYLATTLVAGAVNYTIDGSTPTLAPSSWAPSASPTTDSNNNNIGLQKDVPWTSNESKGINQTTLILAIAGGALAAVLLAGLFVQNKKKTTETTFQVDDSNDWQQDEWKVGAPPNKILEDLARDQQEEDTWDAEDDLTPKKTPPPNATITTTSPTATTPRTLPPTPSSASQSQQSSNNNSKDSTPSVYSNNVFGWMWGMLSNQNDDIVEPTALENENSSSSDSDFGLPSGGGGRGDYNDDDELISDFDESVMKIVPHNNTGIIPVEQMESFEHQRRHYLSPIKKDMMTTNNVVLIGGNGNGGSGKQYHHVFPDKSDQCVLSPTDFSATTLAKPNPGSSPLDLERGGFGKDGHRLPSDLTAPQFHVLPQQQRTTVDGEFAAAAQHHSLSHPRQYTGSGGYQSSSDAGTYDQQDLWDPDDASMSGTSVASTDIGTEFSFITNKDEQSLLQHSLRNESYKMQRLRTPPPPSLKLLAETPIDNIDPATGKRILRGAGGEKLIL